MDLVNLDAEVDLEVGQFFHLLLQGTNQVLEVRAKIIGYLHTKHIQTTDTVAAYEVMATKG